MAPLDSPQERPRLVAADMLLEESALEVILDEIAADVGQQWRE